MTALGCRHFETVVCADCERRVAILLAHIKEVQRENRRTAVRLGALLVLFAAILGVAYWVLP